MVGGQHFGVKIMMEIGKRANIRTARSSVGGQTRPPAGRRLLKRKIKYEKWKGHAAVLLQPELAWQHTVQAGVGVGGQPVIRWRRAAGKWSPPPPPPRSVPTPPSPGREGGAGELSSSSSSSAQRARGGRVALCTWQRRPSAARARLPPPCRGSLALARLSGRQE